MRNDEFEVRFRDLLIPHLIELTRYQTGAVKRAIKSFNRELKNLESELAKRLVTIEKRGIDLGPTVTKRLNNQIKEVRALIDGAYSKTNEQILTELAELADDEVTFTTKALKTVKRGISKDAKRKVSLEVEYPTNTPAPALVRSVAETSPMLGNHLKWWADKASADTKDAVEKAIRDGIKAGDTTDKIVRRIVGTRAARFTDGIVQDSRNAIDALVRTAVTHIHNNAAQLSYAANDDVVKGWRFLAVLDTRTTVRCAGMSGKVFQIGQGPIPPLHVRCRSLCQPVTVTMRELGIDVDEPGSSKRASMDGPVDGDITFDRWLASKSAAIQDDMLGKTRADLFRRGKLKLADLVKDDGRELTLKELRARHPKAFE